MKFRLIDGDRGKTVLTTTEYSQFRADLEYFMLKKMDGTELTVTVSTYSRGETH